MKKATVNRSEVYNVSTNAAVRIFTKIASLAVSASSKSALLSAACKAITSSDEREAAIFASSPEGKEIYEMIITARRRSAGARAAAAKRRKPDVATSEAKGCAEDTENKSCGETSRHRRIEKKLSRKQRRRQSPAGESGQRPRLKIRHISRSETFRN